MSNEIFEEFNSKDQGVKLYQNFCAKMKSHQTYQRVRNCLLTNVNIAGLKELVENGITKKHEDITILFRNGLFQADINNGEICIPFCPIIPCDFHPVKGQITCDVHHTEYEAYWKDLSNKPRNDDMKRLTKARKGTLLVVTELKPNNGMSRSITNSINKKFKSSTKSKSDSNILEINKYSFVGGNSFSNSTKGVMAASNSKVGVNKRDESVKKPVSAKKQTSRKRIICDPLELGTKNGTHAKQKKYDNKGGGVISMQQKKNEIQNELDCPEIELLNISDSDNSPKYLATVTRSASPTKSTVVQQEGKKESINKESISSCDDEEESSIPILASAISSESGLENSEVDKLTNESYWF